MPANRGATQRPRYTRHIWSTPLSFRCVHAGRYCIRHTAFFWNIREQEDGDVHRNPPALSPRFGGSSPRSHNIAFGTGEGGRGRLVTKGGKCTGDTRRSVDTGGSTFCLKGGYGFSRCVGTRNLYEPVSGSMSSGPLVYNPGVFWTHSWGTL